MLQNKNLLANIGFDTAENAVIASPRRERPLRSLACALLRLGQGRNNSHAHVCFGLAEGMDNLLIIPDAPHLDGRIQWRVRPFAAAIWVGAEADEQTHNFFFSSHNPNIQRSIAKLLPHL